MPKNKEYEILIHTDSYAGNFERQLRSFVTGCEGDNDFVDLTGDIREFFAGEKDGDWEESEENPFYDLFRRVRGEYGMRIEEIATTPKKYGEGCNTVILHLNANPSEEQLDILKAWTLRFAECTPNTEWHVRDKVKILGCELVVREIKVIQTNTEF
jgi:hypothetical protein